MESDLNRYDLHHVTTAHAQMSAVEWQDAVQTAWTHYYTPRHIETLLRRARASGIKTSRMAKAALWFHGCSMIEGLHPLDCGVFRMKTRHERRPGLPIESPLRFYPRYGWEIVSKHLRYLRLVAWLRWLTRRVDRDPKGASYRDTASTA